MEPSEGPAGARFAWSQPADARTWIPRPCPDGDRCHPIPVRVARRVARAKTKAKARALEHGNKVVDGRLAKAVEKTEKWQGKRQGPDRLARARARATAPNASIVANLVIGRGTADSFRGIERMESSDLSLRLQRMLTQVPSTSTNGSRALFDLTEQAWVHEGHMCAVQCVPAMKRGPRL